MANTWKIARGKGSPQLSIAIVALFAAALVVLGRAQSSLFDRARTYFSDVTAPMLESVREPLNATGRWVRGLDDIFVVYQENLRLKEENARLRQWRNNALVLEQRINRYQLLLNAVTDPSLSAVTAHVIGRANRPFLDTVILDAGKNQGIKPGEAVVDARGMIGRVYLVGNHTAWVILLTDLSSRIPVAIEPGHVQAILSGDNSATPGLELSKQGSPLKDGAEIVTSGDGGLLPPGLAVGNIFWNGSEFRAQLLADSTTADDVRILDLRTPAEQAPAPSPGSLPVSAAGLPPRAPHQLAPPAAPQLPPITVPGTPTIGMSPLGTQPVTKPSALLKPGTAATQPPPAAEEQDQ
jgi:rod shape-determining protein MreC